MTISIEEFIYPAVKLSSKSRYGLRALFDIAFHGAGEPVQIRDIAERQGIPPRFLEQIFQDLKRVGLVTSKRGPRGGYALARSPAEIRVGDILRAIEGNVELADASARQQGSDRAGAETIDDALAELSRDIEQCFDALSLQDLCNRREPRTGPRLPQHRYLYTI